MTDLVLDSITVRRAGRVVLDTVATRFAAGRLTAVIGPNGAGKSTLLQVAAGVLRPAAGSVMLGDRPISSYSSKALATLRAYLPQMPKIDWPISVERVVALGLIGNLPAFGGLPEAARSQIDLALDRYDLNGLRDRPATQVSGGELARVMLARATVGNPRLLIVDEPTAGLDPRHALDASRRLRALADEGCTVIVALHDLDLAHRIADDVVAMKSARIVAQGTLAATFTATMLSDLYDVEAELIRHDHGSAIRFLA